MKTTYIVHSICEEKAWKFGAPRASEPSISMHLSDCSSPENSKLGVLNTKNLNLTCKIELEALRIYKSAMHVKCVLLKAGDPSGKPLLFVFDSISYHIGSFLVNLGDLEFVFAATASEDPSLYWSGRAIPSLILNSVQTLRPISNFPFFLSGVKFTFLFIYIYITHPLSY